MAATVVPPPPVELVLSKLPYRFSDPRYFMEAMRAAGSGYNIRSKSLAVDGHKRLAQVGSTVMKAAILGDWYKSGADRVVATQCIDKIGSYEVLNECSRRIGLQDCISTNPSQGVQQPSPAIIARAVQALFGAIWLDSQENMKAVRQVLCAVGLHAVPHDEQNL